MILAQKTTQKRSFAAGSRLFVAIHVLCVLLPLGIVLTWAFTSSWPWPELFPQGFTDRGITEIFVSQRDLGFVLAQSVFIALAVAVLTTAVATCAARAFVHHYFVGKEIFRFMTVLPFLIPTTVFAMGVQVAFIKAGLANTVIGVVVAHSIVALPYAVIIMTDITHAAGTRLEQQARVSGAGHFKTLLHVQGPLLLPGFLSAASLSYIISFSQYFLTLLIGGGTIKTFAVVMFPYLASSDRTIASAYGVVFLLVTFSVFVLFELLVRRYTKKRLEYFNG